MTNVFMLDANIFIDMHRRPLGNVCRQLGVPRQDTFQMLRQLEVHFQWTGS